MSDSRILRRSAPNVKEEEAPPAPAKPLLLGSSSSRSAAAYFSICTSSTAADCVKEYKVPPEFELCAPTPEKRADSPPPGYAAVYLDHFKSGLKLPPPPFLVAILDHYELALAQLHPNGIYDIVGFLKICEGRSIVPTIGLFRFFFQLQRSIHSKGWYTFRAIRPNKIVHGQPLWVSRWKDAFFFFKVTEDVKILPWNDSPIVSPPLPQEEKPSAQVISILTAKAKPPKRKFADVPKTPLQSEGTSMAVSRQKRTADNSSSEGLKDMNTEQFGRFMESSISSFCLQVQKEKEELQKENALLKSVVDDRGALLKVFTQKLLKSKGFSKFCDTISAAANKLGRHVAVKKIQASCPSVPFQAFSGLEDSLAKSNLDNLLYNMVQDDAIEFPLLDHLLSLPEIPSSSRLKDLDEDEDKNALIPPPPVARK